VLRIFVFTIRIEAKAGVIHKPAAFKQRPAGLVFLINQCTDHENVSLAKRIQAGGYDSSGETGTAVIRMDSQAFDPTSAAVIGNQSGTD